MFLRLSLISLMLICLQSEVRGDEFLANFSLAVKGEHVVVSWTTTANFRCEDLKVEHGTDTGQMTEVYTYPGICGAEGKVEHYFYVFNKIVFNRTNYFRINLGIYGYSEFREVKVIRRTGLKPLILPNPANPLSVIHFSNEDHQLATIELLDVMGRSIGEVVQTSESEVPVSAFPSLISGTYLVVIEMKGQISYLRFFYN